MTEKVARPMKGFEDVCSVANTQYSQIPDFSPNLFESAILDGDIEFQRSGMKFYPCIFCILMLFVQENKERERKTQQEGKREPTRAPDEQFAPGLG